MMSVNIIKDKGKKYHRSRRLSQIFTDNVSEYKGISTKDARNCNGISP